MLEKKLSLVFASTLTGILLISSNAMAFGIPGFGGGDDKKSSSAGKCVDRNAGGDISWTDKIAKIALEEVMDTAAKEILTVKSLKLPKKITNTCDADKRLQYVEETSKLFNKSATKALGKVGECYGLFGEGKGHDSESSEAVLTMVNDVSKGLTKDGNAKRTNANNSCASAATGSLKGLVTYGGTVVGWDKELIDFGKDNFPWALKNASLLKKVLGNATDISTSIGTIGTSIVLPIWDSLTPYDKKKATKHETETREASESADRTIDKNIKY